MIQSLAQFARVLAALVATELVELVFNALATKQRPTPDTGHHGLVAATIATKHASTTATGRTREHKLAIDHRPQGDGFAAIASVTEHARRASTSLRTEDASDPP